MNTNPILLKEHPAEGVVLLRLNRPEVLNALNLALRQSIALAMDQASDDPAVKAWPFTAAITGFLHPLMAPHNLSI